MSDFLLDRHFSQPLVKFSYNEVGITGIGNSYSKTRWRVIINKDRTEKWSKSISYSDSSQNYRV